MKRKNKSLLPNKNKDRDALNFVFANIKPRLILIRQLAEKDLQRLKKITLVVTLMLILMGYQPIFTFPAVKKVEALASQQQQITAENLPQPINLPHPGYLSTRFSSFHKGVDIVSGLGMPIYPITAGVVEEVNFSFWGLGNHLMISHTGGFKSTYGHMGRVFAKIGQQVSPSNIIGEVGLTGATSGPHTHLEVTFNGEYIDPQTILPEIPKFPKPDYFQAVNGTTIIKPDLHKNLRPDFN